MTKRPKQVELPKRAVHFIEAACLHAIGTGWPEANVMSVEIERLDPPVEGANWKVGKITPTPSDASADAKIRKLVAYLPGKWALDG